MDRHGSADGQEPVPSASPGRDALSLVMRSGAWERSSVSAAAVPVVRQVDLGAKLLAKGMGRLQAPDNVRIAVLNAWMYLIALRRLADFGDWSDPAHPLPRGRRPRARRLQPLRGTGARRAPGAAALPPRRGGGLRARGRALAARRAGLPAAVRPPGCPGAGRDPLDRSGLGGATADRHRVREQTSSASSRSASPSRRARRRSSSSGRLPPSTRPRTVPASRCPA